MWVGAQPALQVNKIYLTNICQHKLPVGYGLGIPWTWELAQSNWLLHIKGVLAGHLAQHQLQKAGPKSATGGGFPELGLPFSESPYQGLQYILFYIGVASFTETTKFVTTSLLNAAKQLQ